MVEVKPKARASKSRATKKAAASKPAKTTARKAKPKKKVSPAGAPSATPMVAEHPEGVFARLHALREEMDNLFTSMTRSFGLPEMKMPSLELPSRHAVVDVRFEVSESDKALEVKAEVPGLTEDDIEVELSDGMLTIKGKKRDDREEKKKDYYIRECRYGSFSRSFRIPDSVIEDDITADLEEGVLHVSLPKRAVAKRGPKAVKVSKKR